MKQKRFISYTGAVNFLKGKNFVLCNEALQLDENLLSDLELQEGQDIFSCYLTDLSEDEVKFLTKNFKGL
ncbi:hypothetical protein [Campylobacter troglodytis]|uniref:hypothetical protein n=1 Tax=Campylobacter troglodytis TaxID=654363 RepID=UPI0011580EC9|nr:hypothetical protein [Campylobacter troglodytis]